jgi:hypothetical protein
MDPRFLHRWTWLTVTLSMAALIFLAAAGLWAQEQAPVKPSTPPGVAPPPPDKSLGSKEATPPKPRMRGLPEEEVQPRMRPGPPAARSARKIGGTEIRSQEGTEKQE